MSQQESRTYMIGVNGVLYSVGRLATIINSRDYSVQKPVLSQTSSAEVLPSIPIEVVRCLIGIHFKSHEFWIFEIPAQDSRIHWTGYREAYVLVHFWLRCCTPKIIDCIRTWQVRACVL